jgi:hypothetical protein
MIIKTDTWGIKFELSSSFDRGLEYHNCLAKVFRMNPYRDREGWLNYSGVNLIKLLGAYLGA